MASIFTPKGKVYRNDSVDFRLAIVDTETNLLVQRSQVVRISAALWRMHPSPKEVANWSLNVEDVLVDGPIFHAQDSGWPYADKGYNFRWDLPRDYLVTAPAKYRMVFRVEKVGLKLSTHAAEIEVQSAEYGT